MTIVSRLLASCAVATLLLSGATVTAAAATSACTVAYSVGNNWAGGFQAGVTITNNGPAISNWTLAFAFPNDQQVTNG
ncbi:MAG TPA: cellulose binding domain-containing protein [Pseudonocardiaceae bacterium]|nr:cellulose binding domain-containing protein [Pseudonocardiaceae bacterium]